MKDLIKDILIIVVSAAMTHMGDRLLYNMERKSKKADNKIDSLVSSEANIQVVSKGGKPDTKTTIFFIKAVSEMPKSVLSDTRDMELRYEIISAKTAYRCERECYQISVKNNSQNTMEFCRFEKGDEALTLPIPPSGKLVKSGKSISFLFEKDDASPMRALIFRWQEELFKYNITDPEAGSISMPKHYREQKTAKRKKNHQKINSRANGK